MGWIKTLFVILDKFLFCEYFGLLSVCREVFHKLVKNNITAAIAANPHWIRKIAI